MIVGIDPDIEQSGVACLSGRMLILDTFCFVGLIDFIKREKASIKRVYIEAGWLNKKSSWHGAKSNSTAARIGKNVGENHATGKLLVQCISAMGIEVVKVRPTSKKLDADQFKRLTGYEKRTNQETRDAAMLVFGMYS